MTTPKPVWTCGFCSSGNCDACRSASLNPGGKIKILVCGCPNHDKRVRCLECGNTHPDELTGWACTNPTDCADAIAARSARNPLRKELEIVRTLGGEARRRALDERLRRQIQAAVEASGIDRELGEDVAAPPPRRAPRPTSGVCLCGCGGATRGGRFQPGHDAKLKGRLTKAVEAGEPAAYDELVRLGWEKFAIKAVGRRRAALDRARGELVG